jgi:carbamate kinase
VRVLEAPLIRALVGAGMIPIAVGGGGIPVVETETGVRGVEAFIEKDLATAVLARDLGADHVLFLTGVERVALGFGTPGERLIDRLSAAEARRLLVAGQFPPGSMGPKVEAAVQFVEQGGGAAVITSLDRVSDAMAGRAGTHFVRNGG